MTLSEADVGRYSRQLVLPEWSGAAQQRLREARVAVVGAGALGGPVGAYLVGAGVGRLDVIDSDRVELSNLHRQILFTEADVGEPKAAAAARRLAPVNRGVEVSGREVRLDEENAAGLLEGASVVVDCSDSFPTRYAVNDAACAAGTPLVEAGVLGLEGLVLSVRPGRSACYRCAFPVAPPPGSVPSCREGGVLGPVAGLVASVQALEALKLLSGVGEPLLDRMLQLDARDMTQMLVSTRRRPECPACARVPVATAAAA